MDVRKLSILPEDKWDTDGYVVGPAILASIDPDDGEKMNIPVYGVSKEQVDGITNVVVARTDGTRYYPINEKKGIRVNPNTNDITFSSYGRIYTVRAFQDSDGSWGSRFGIDVPAESLEERYMSEVENAFTPNAPADDENLYAAVDGETDEVKNLIYSTADGMYMRADGGWFRIPEKDTSLDNLEVYEVDPKFIRIYDAADANSEKLLADDVRPYEVEFRGGEV